jgi:hypothetical protein
VFNETVAAGFVAVELVDTVNDVLFMMPVTYVLTTNPVPVNSCPILIPAVDAIVTTLDPVVIPIVIVWMLLEPITGPNIYVLIVKLNVHWISLASP